MAEAGQPAYQPSQPSPAASSPSPPPPPPPARPPPPPPPPLVGGWVGRQAPIRCSERYDLGGRILVQVCFALVDFGSR